MTSPEKPTADSIIESQSTCGLLTLLTLSNEVIAKISAKTKNGINSQKIQRQESLARISPVSVGPIAGANIITSAQIPNTAPSFWGGKICIATANISGRINPVPIPCTIRPINTPGKLLAQAEITAPMIKLSKPKIMI